MTTATALHSASKILNSPPSAICRRVDLTRGAVQFGIRARVLLSARILEDYAELDPTVGHNTAGMVLAVLSYYLASGNVGLGDETLTVCLRRRRDGQAAEVDLELHRTRAGDQKCFTLGVAGEREVEA